MSAAAQGDVREYAAKSWTTDTFGRVMCNSRNHYFVIDGPVANGCPGEEVTPAEMFLASVAACGAELLQVIARQQGVALQEASASIYARQDRGNPARQDYSVFNTVQMEFHLKGVSEEEGTQLVEAFKRR